MQSHAALLRRAAALAALLAALLPIACSTSPKNPPPVSAAPQGPGAPDWIFEDFERPDPPVTWTPATATSEPATQPETAPATAPALPILHRSAARPQSGLWSLAASLSSPGTLTYTPRTPLDFSNDLELTLPVFHTDSPARNGEFTASAAIVDAGGHRFESDAFPVLSTWEPIELDLRNATTVDRAAITQIDIILRRTHPADADDGPLAFLTDAWSAHAGVKKYIGDRAGKLRTFFVESGAGQIRLGTVGQYEIIFSDCGAPPASNLPIPSPWLRLFAALHPLQQSEDFQRISLDRVLGQENTGLFLLDQSALDALSRRTDADDAPVEAANPPPLPAPWAASPLVRTTLHVAWSSPIAAMIEGTQEFGPYDRLGEPAVMLNWRFMIYQWGQAFVHVHWTRPGENAASIPEPVSWALITDPAAAASQDTDTLTTGSADAQERLLSEVYTPAFRANLKTVLPHRMQAAAPVTLIAGAGPQKDNFWWAQASLPSDPLIRRRIMGSGLLPNTSPTTAAQADCMLLLNNPNPLTRAGTFSQYLSPPKIVMRQGELDLTVPGDIDNDGFNEAYGFQAIRLSAGRAAFTIYPQNRPIFYPVCLFTVPAAERDALDVKHSRLLVNVDGRQFADPPVFPDGSFLLQIPYVLDRPVSIEALLVKQ